MKLEPGLKRSAAFHVDELRREAVAEGRAVFVLPRRIQGRADFFAAVRAVFPLDPPLQSDRSWDALNDSLWSGLFDFPARQIVILWPGARLLQTSAPEDFDIAFGILADLPHSMAEPTFTQGRPKEVAIVIEVEQ